MYQLNEEPFWSETFQAQVANLPAGAHLCQVYRTIVEQLECAVTFCRGGIRRNQQCLYLARPRRARKLLRSIQATGQRINAVPGRFELIVQSSRDSYARDGHFSPEAMLDYLRWQADQARRGGFTGLRVAAQMDWVLQPDVPTEVFFAFEGPGLHDFATATGTRFIGQFDRRQFRPEILLGVLRTHPLVVIGSYVLDNLYYEPLSLVRDNTPAAADRRVDWQLSQLQERMRRVVALADLEHWALAGAAPDDLMEAAVHLVAFELKSGMAEIFEILPDSNAFTLAASFGWRDSPDPRPAAWNAPAQALLAHELRIGRPFIVPDWRDEDRLTPPPAFKVNGVASSILVAISGSRDGRLLGILGAHFRHPRVFPLGEIVYLEKVATALACAIIRARSVDKLRAFVENAPDLIARFDGDLRVVYVNTALATIADTPPAALLGKTLRQSGAAESFASAWESILRRAWRTGREQTNEFVLPTPQGERFFQARIVPETGRDDTVQSLLVIARDMTDLRQAEAERTDLSLEVTGLRERLAEVGSLPRSLDQELHRVVFAPQAEQLTEREREILRLLTLGWTNRQISARTGLAFGTVKNYVSQLLAKLGVTDRTQAAVRAVEFGFVQRGAEH